ncbi:MAG: regulatory protein RecX [Actinomycetota bacterium]
MDEPAGARPADPATQEAKARSIVLRQLGTRARTREQLWTRLLDRGIPESVARRVLDRFEEVGLVDDSAYAEMLVRTRREQRGLSRRALAREMRTHGVDEEIAAAALEDVSREDEEATALVLAGKKAASTRGLERSVRERRIAAMLGRKGYGVEVVVRVTRRALDEE